MITFVHMAKENVYLASKPRYEILDGLRGVAALMVVIFHCFETYVPVFKTQIVNHGFSSSSCPASSSGMRMTTAGTR